MVVGISLRGDVLDQIYNKQIEYRFDSEFMALWNLRKNHAGLERKGIIDGMDLSRRVLEVAYMEAMSAKDVYKSHIISDWRKVSKAAEVVEKAIVKFHQATGYQKERFEWSNKRPDEAIPPWIGVRPLESIISQIERQQGNSVDFKGLKPKAEALLNALMQIEEFSRAASIAAKTHSRRVALTHKNVGNPEVVAFAKTVCEALVFLNGKAPSQGNTAFMNLLSAGWSDISDIEQEWEHTARKSIALVDGGRVEYLAIYGPEWLLPVLRVG